MTTEHENLKQIVEAALFAFGEPMTVDKLQQLFPELERPEADQIREIITQLEEEYADKGVELVKIASGYRFQARAKYSPWLQRLWEKRPPKYTRALLETVALIAYRQPITRGEIEEVRGVAVSTNIIKTLMDREWVKVVGQKEVPGRPALFGTTKDFLDYFNLTNVNALPPLEELLSIEEIEKRVNEELGFEAKAETKAEAETEEGAELEAESEAELEAERESEQENLDESPAFEMVEEVVELDLPSDSAQAIVSDAIEKIQGEVDEVQESPAKE